MTADRLTSTHVRTRIDRVLAGEPDAAAALIAHTLDRLRRLAARLLRGRAELRPLGQTDDVLQPALVRLHRALAQVRPPSGRAYFGLAARHLRWVLGEMARDLRRRPPHTALVPDAADPRAPDADPADLLAWSEFHAAVAELPGDERAVFELVFYQGLALGEAAAVLGVGERTAKRRWRAARLGLDRALHGEWPGG